MRVIIEEHPDIPGQEFLAYLEGTRKVVVTASSLPQVLRELAISLEVADLFESRK